jgi:predicted NUDIX family phosphoesterase
VSAGEEVLVIARDLMPDDASWTGIRPFPLDRLVRLIERAGQLRPRAQMEADPAWKQIIPYVVLRDGSRYFLMRRTRAGGDARLHDRWSIGVGGHLNPGDHTLHAGLVREWTEEIEADFVPEFGYVGLLNDESTDVGRVHLGVVFVADAAGRPARIREVEKLEGRFAEPGRVAEVADRLETWSRLVFDHLESGAAG